jgi:hypothetical protein
LAASLWSKSGDSGILSPFARIAKEERMASASPSERVAPAVQRIVAAVAELDRALDAATPDEQMFAVYVAVEQLVGVYLKIAQLNRRFHLCCERGELPQSMFS